jgi:hypothetical protein
VKISNFKLEYSDAEYRLRDRSDSQARSGAGAIERVVA